MKDEAKMVDYWIKKLDVMKDYRLVDMLACTLLSWLIASKNQYR